MTHWIHFLLDTMGCLPVAMMPASLLLLFLAFLPAAAQGESGSVSGDPRRGALAVAVACGLALATAAVVHALVSRQAATGRATASQKKKTPVASVLQRDEELERAAEASAQVFPVGARVKLAGSRGDGVVFGYDAAEDTVEVQLVENGKQAVKVGRSELVQPRVTDFFIYPIKSCGAIRLESAVITGWLGWSRRKRTIDVCVGADSVAGRQGYPARPRVDVRGREGQVHHSATLPQACSRASQARAVDRVPDGACHSRRSKNIVSKLMMHWSLL